MRGGPPDNSVNDQYRTKKPKSLRDVPRFLRELLGSFFSRLFYIFRLVWETQPSLLLLMVFIAVFNGVTPVIGSLISARIINQLAEVYAGAALAFGTIAVLLIWQFAYMLITGTVQDLYSTILSIAGEKISNHVKLMLMRKAETVDMMSFDSPDFYARLENANREAGMQPLNIVRNTFAIVSTIISMASFAVVLFAVSPLAPLIILAAAIPSTVVLFIYRRKNVDYMSRRSKARREMSYYSDVLVDKDMVKEIRMFGLTDVLCNKYQTVFTDYFKGLRRLKLEECLWDILLSVATNAIYCLLYIYVAKQVFDGVFPVGNFALYTGAINSFKSGVGAVIATTASIYERTLFINNLKSFLEEKPTIVPSIEEPAHVARHQDHTITFENVSFRYPGMTRDVLQNVNVTIEPGETVVIVGLNGAGKTTLVKLLTRLYDPTAGRVTLDGRDIREYDVKELYRTFGIIFQDFGKYAASAGENIRFGDTGRDGTDAELNDAAERSGADEFIGRLPAGFDTPLMRVFEESGAELSIGQWQKLAISRAFYSDSDILILDEPTASLDPLAEQEIFNQFNELRHGKTSIFISHRLSSATIADKILVMENGQIIEVGNHRALMEKRGRYYELFSVQAAHYVGATETNESEDKDKEETP